MGLSVPPALRVRALTGVVKVASRLSCCQTKAVAPAPLTATCGGRASLLPVESCCVAPSTPAALRLRVSTTTSPVDCLNVVQMNVALPASSTPTSGQLAVCAGGE